MSEPVNITPEDINKVMAEDETVRLKAVNAALTRQRDEALARVEELERELASHNGYEPELAEEAVAN